MSDLYEVEILKTEGRLTSIYVEAYEKRYHTKPVLSSNNSDQTILKDLLRQLGPLKLSYLLDHYLKMNDEWFAKKAHSLAVLKDNVNVVLADLSLRQSKAVPKGVCITLRFGCDECHTDFQCTVPLNYNWDTRTLCDECKVKEGQPWRS